ncbi:MAG TPA: ATP-binding protein [Opitutaceae bacterium]|nr:ATP-binding protein [Opitutaceae bacterium]
MDAPAESPAPAAPGLTDCAPIAEALLKAFLENVPDIVYFKDRDSRFIAVSKSKAVRHGCARPEELTGKSDVDIFSPAYARTTRAEEEIVMSGGVSIVGKIQRISWPDGRITWSRTSKLPLRNAAGEIIGTCGISQDITASRQMEEALEKAHKEIIDASRLAGMAEVATGVLHNVGNVLNSLNVSATVLGAGLRQSKLESLAKVSGLLREHASDLGAFLTEDPKGKLVPEFIESLAKHSLDERGHLLQELDSLQQNIDHIKEIVSMQQAYATMVGIVEPLEASVLMEDSLRMNSAALLRHDIAVVREFQPAPPVFAERGKVLQILINLIRNAKYALDEGRATDKIVTLRIEPTPAGAVRFVIRDNGIGIAPGNLDRIFNHGFTTRTHGHGFGLHSSALAAKEMKGTLSVHSAGPGQGAEFRLELPSSAPAQAPAPAPAPASASVAA